MDTKTVCLGLLTLGDASGYDLKKHFEGVFEHFFSAGYGSIYPALAALADEGLVTCTEVPQDGRPDRKVYRITAAGRRRLNEALETAVPSHKTRSEFLVAIYFAHLMSPERLATLLDQRLGELGRMLEHMQACPDTSCWPAGIEFVRGFGEAVSAAARRYIETHRDDLIAASARHRDAEAEAATEDAPRSYARAARTAP